MNHADIEEHQVIDRYVMGTLPPDEAERFEDHYLSCPECLDQLALAESMQRGFKRAAGQDAARVAVTRQLALFAWLSRLGRSRQAAVLAMALLAVVAAVLPGGLALRRLGERDRELAETQRALEQEQKQSTERSAAGSRTTAEIEKQLAEIQRDLTREREARAEAVEQLAEAQGAQVNVPILFLGVVRGGANEEPVDRLRRPSGAGRAILGLQIEPPFASSYQVILHAPNGRELWRGKGLHPNERDELTVSIPGRLLEPGDYTVTAEGVGGPASRSRFTFRVLP